MPQLKQKQMGVVIECPESRPRPSRWVLAPSQVTHVPPINDAVTSGHSLRHNPTTTLDHARGV